MPQKRYWMECVSLIVLVPAVVAPVVLLCGFAECGAMLGWSPVVPVITSVRLLDGPMEVSWDYAGDQPATFKVVGSKGTIEIRRITPPGDGSTLQHRRSRHCNAAPCVHVCTRASRIRRR